MPDQIHALEADHDPFELAGFVTRHHISLGFQDWRVLSDLLPWLSAVDARLVSVHQAELQSGQSEATLTVEGVRASLVRDWLCRAKADGRVHAVRLEHLLTALNPAVSVK